MLYSVNHSEFAALKEAFPQSADMLEGLVNYVGPKAVIHLDQISKKTAETLDEGVLDHLYHTAYQISGDRFWSYFLQFREILNLKKSNVNRILEIGPGTGMLASLLRNYDYRHFTLDIKPYNPSHIRGDLLQLPVGSNSVDLICAFEVLQHVPHMQFCDALSEMARCARHYVYISLPCPTNSVFFQLRLSFLQRLIRRFSFGLEWFLTLPTRLSDKNEQALFARQDRHNPHYWEVNRKSYPKSRVCKEIESCGLEICRTFHNPLYPYHFFILCQIT